MQYTQQDLQKMRERAIQGAFEMQKKAQLRQNGEKKPSPQMLPQPKPPQVTAEPPGNPQKSSAPQKPQGAAPNQWVEKLKAAEMQRKAEEAQKRAANTPKNTGGMPHHSRKNSSGAAAAPNEPLPTASDGVSGQRRAPEGRGSTSGVHNKKREERRAQEPPPGCQAACPVGRVWQNRKSADTQEDSDAMLILFLVMLLMQEGAEQSLLFSLLYIIL